MSNLPEIDIPAPEDTQDRFSRVVAVTIAAATLGAAFLGFLQSQAASANGAASLRAQRLGIDAVERRLVEERRAQVELGTYARAVAERVEAGNLQQQQFYAGEGADAERLKVQQEAWVQLAERSEALTSIKTDGPDGPREDPTFPNRFLARATREALRLEALQDAANENGSAWGNRAATYTALLAVLAVALYLLGFSLTIGLPRAKRLFAVVGSLLALLAVTVGSASALSPPTLPSDDAAAAFADGMVALQTAYDDAGYQLAYDRLSEAIRMRPTFARAYEARSEASYALGSPQRSGFASLTTPEALRRSDGDLRRAREFGLADSRVLGNLGFHTFLLALQDRSASFDDSISFSREAIAVNELDPVLRFNLGVALLAAGRLGEARSAYDEAIRRLLFVDVDAGTLRDTLQLPAYVAGALTDLALVETFRPELAGDVQATRELIVGSAARGALGPPDTAVRVNHLAAEAFPSLLQWRGDLDQFNADTDTLSAVWYHRDPKGLGWAALPEATQLVVSPTPNVDPAGGAYFGLARYVASTFPPRCLPQGEYRVELYSGGRQIGRAETSSATAGFEPFTSREIGATFCRPGSWPAAVGVPGFVEGYTAPDIAAGVYLIRVQWPRPGDAATDLAGLAIDASMSAFGSLFPATPTLDASSGTATGYFMGLEGGQYRWYSYDGGYVRVGAGVGTDGGVIIGLVYGPVDWFDGDEWKRIMESFEQFR